VICMVGDETRGYLTVWLCSLALMPIVRIPERREVIESKEEPPNRWRMERKGETSQALHHLDGGIKVCWTPL
jgi:hypothetical protein